MQKSENETFAAALPCVLQPVRVVLVTCAAVFGDLLENVISSSEGCLLIGRSHQISSAGTLVRELRPDVMVLHIRDVKGVNLLDLHAANPSLRLVILTEDLTTFAVTIIAKVAPIAVLDTVTCTVGQIESAWSDILSGRTFYSTTYHANLGRQIADPSAPHKILSDRECVVLGLIGLGMSDQEIGNRLCVTERTAQTHRSHIMCKLNIPSSAKLVAFAVSHGFA